MFSLNKFPKFSFTNKWWFGRDFNRTTFTLMFNSSGLYDHLNAWVWKFDCLLLSMWNNAFTFLSLGSSVTFPFLFYLCTKVWSHRSAEVEMEKFHWILTYNWGKVWSLSVAHSSAFCLNHVTQWVEHGSSFFFPWGNCSMVQKISLFWNFSLSHT